MSSECPQLTCQLLQGAGQLGDGLVFGLQSLNQVPEHTGRGERGPQEAVNVLVGLRGESSTCLQVTSTHYWNHYRIKTL